MPRHFVFASSVLVLVGVTNAAAAQLLGDPALDAVGSLLSDDSLGCVTTERGSRVIQSCDVDGDGVADYHTERRLDADGHVVTSRTRGLGDELTQCVRYRYDDAGRLTRESQDLDCDGSDDARASYHYTDEGYPLAERFDGDGDGRAEATVRWRYDAAGHRASVEYRYSESDGGEDTTCRYDPPCPPPFDACWGSEHCWPADGPEPIAIATLVEPALAALGATPCACPTESGVAGDLCGCDDQKRVVYRATDFDGDGWVDDVRTQRWDEATGGWLETIDIGGDGGLDVENHFDVTGRLLAAWWHDDTDGRADRGLIYVWDAAGRLARSETWLYGSASTRTTYTWDEAGNPLAEVRDDRADGSPDYVWSATYDRLGRLAIVTWDCGADGVAEASAVYAYDPDGRRVLAHGVESFSCASLETPRGSARDVPPIDSQMR